jgi:predicted secreted protein
MPNAAIKGQGFVLAIETGASSPIVWTPVAGIKSFSQQDAEAADIDITDLQSQEKEYLVGLPDSGSYTGDCNFLLEDPGQIAMRAARASQAVQRFKATFSDTSTAEFSGFVKSMPISGGVDQAVTGTFSIKVTGAIVMTPAP